MEAVRDFRPFRDADQASGRVRFPGVVAGVEAALAALQGAGPMAVADSASWVFRAASDFAGRVEELSRTMEYFYGGAHTGAIVESVKTVSGVLIERGTGAEPW